MQNLPSNPISSNSQLPPLRSLKLDLPNAVNLESVSANVNSNSNNNNTTGMQISTFSPPTNKLQPSFSNTSLLISGTPNSNSNSYANLSNLSIETPIAQQASSSSILDRQNNNDMLSINLNQRGNTTSDITNVNVNGYFQR
ncbi:unnamed protein product [[Candida] boidinii]|uniref:Unnamed protein product n=1 Tax=Candida boidinii TaxID=5477 RepID=A0A9W6T6R8_CANBO|nr:unnamed protein product [[Candida] boidinii]